MQVLQSGAGVVEPALGAAAGLGRWFLGVAVLPLSGVFQLRRSCLVTTVHRALPVCEWPVLGMTRGRAPQGQTQPLQCAAGVAGPGLGAATVLGRGFVGGAVLPVSGDFQRRRQHSATTVHRALPVCVWPDLGKVK